MSVFGMFDQEVDFRCHIFPGTSTHQPNFLEIPRGQILLFPLEAEAHKKVLERTMVFRCG